MCVPSRVLLALLSTWGRNDKSFTARTEFARINPSRDYTKIMSGKSSTTLDVRISLNHNPLGGRYFAGHAVLVTSCINQEGDRGGSKHSPVLFSKEDGTLWQDEQHKSPANSSHLDSSVDLFDIVWNNEKRIELIMPDNIAAFRSTYNLRDIIYVLLVILNNGYYPVMEGYTAEKFYRRKRYSFYIFHRFSFLIHIN